MGTQLVSISETAKSLGVSRDTVRRLAARGQLRTVRVSRRRMVPASEISRIAESGAGTYARQGPATPKGH